MKKIILMILAFISLSLGVAGIFLPLLPTTPFLLLSATLFFRSSEKYYNWLMNHPYLGSFIRNYKINKRIPLKIKIFTLTLLWGTITTTAIFAIDNILIRIILFLIAIGVTIHILSFKN